MGEEEEDEETRTGSEGHFHSDRLEGRGRAQSEWRKDGVRKSMVKDR